MAGCFGINGAPRRVPQILSDHPATRRFFRRSTILEAASNLKWVKAGAAYITKQLTNPDDDFVRMIGRQIYEGSLTKGVVEQLRPAIQSALDEVIRNRIQEKLNVTFAKEPAATESTADKQPEGLPQASEQEIVTTDEERLAFHIVQAIAAKAVAVDRITMRDAKSYCSVFVDDNNRKPVCRFYFNAKTTKSVGIFSPEKEETRHTISSLAEIYAFADRIVETVGFYSK